MIAELPKAPPQFTRPTLQLNRSNAPGRRSIYSQVIDLQELAAKLANCKETKASDVAALIRAWDVLEERKRILRGVPLPGQLRPDLDPVQLARTVKRMKQRRVIDVPGAGKIAIGDWTEADSDPTTSTTQEAGIIKGKSGKLVEHKSMDVSQVSTGDTLDVTQNLHSETLASDGKQAKVEPTKKVEAEPEPEPDSQPETGKPEPEQGTPGELDRGAEAGEKKESL